MPPGRTLKQMVDKVKAAASSASAAAGGVGGAELLAIVGVLLAVSSYPTAAYRWP